MCEMICDTRAGVLFDPGDPVSLAAALRVALESPSLETMGREAHLLATTRYSPETHVDGLMRVFDGVLRSKPAAAGT